MKRTLFSLLLIQAALAPAAADACSVCFSGGDENRFAFLVTTIFLTAMPLILIGSVAFWLRQRIRKLQHAVDVAAELEPGTPSDSPEPTSPSRTRPSHA